MIVIICFFSKENMSASYFGAYTKILVVGQLYRNWKDYLVSYVYIGDSNLEGLHASKLINLLLSLLHTLY